MSEESKTSKSSPQLPPDNNEYNPERFKQATIGVIHALSGRQDTNIHFYSGSSLRNHTPQNTINPTSVHLPNPPEIHDPIMMNQLRGAADAIALRLKYHNQKLHETTQPTIADARVAFDALEQVRVEALGSRYMQGVAANLRSVQEYNSHAEGHARMDKAEQLPPQTALALIAREKLTGEPVPKASRRIVQLWRNRLTKSGEEALDQMVQHMNSQKDYATASQQLLTAYQLMEELEEKEQDSSNDQENENPDSPETSDNPSEENTQEEQEQEQPEEQSPQVAQGIDSNDSSDADEGEGFETQDTPAGPKEGELPPLSEVEDAEYHIYTKKFDEIISADQVCNAEELAFLRQQLDQQLQTMQNIIAKLANRLQRKLMAQQRRRWNFDQEEGLLDASKLPRIITNPMYSLSYKYEQETEFKDTVVTLLIDNSGSMRGKPITIAAMCGDILARTLERCAIKVEVLGFTTRAWKGGRSREEWLKNGKPAQPGRLNDLRHIIYKSADQPWRHARKNLGLMLQEGLLKENIDGEALHWAWQRLRARPEKRKILMIISDGAPVDDSTLSSNNPDYLEMHLRRMIARIESQPDIELTAIGIGHDVTRYYQNAVTITNAEQLGGTMMQELAALFDPKNPKQKIRI
ncbi:Cobalamin biosynthesis cobaltochelatase CobT subunit (CobT2) [Commensalibacter communis]|uniref:Cobalamin biosynthesis cobaltochelatase CobT subunit (CobT2) n=1 Tax=Commensalibacter communis TaxID=2972786 RepID=A0A9W4TQ78_9PROT|nr:cobaltochelatase subunit CobT [Commensalibacter communis]CAI3954716.1 Cobalamin biosynthesis cobaltochelatase CobT subunit (CobT2) [Commensalibacter communis]CAI3955426.1 Cobalamin biosynthesis cobaltochelatase CobT subunit (CobT2) [Commensalibacter communis]CAI3955798.1 Cobalamin biosynthesis cobaltochelatase CobT subunit (CobT2) [Commensalibacter communis]CAI3957867.1 Cobalamin biosynthesis cobaltochelatase CobT subunit (CobT2) [Commensalibacter communis]